MSKAIVFDPPDEQTARLLKAISHPARIWILRCLVARGPQTAGQLASALPLTRPTVSEHLRKLRDQFMIMPRTNGSYLRYEVVVSNLALLSIITTQLFKDLLENNGFGNEDEQYLWPVPYWECSIDELCRG